MGGIRSKLILLLIVYFAGYATAVYTLAPAPKGLGCDSGQDDCALSAIKSGQFTGSLNSAIRKGIDLGKTAAVRAAKAVKRKVKQIELREPPSKRP